MQAAKMATTRISIQKASAMVKRDLSCRWCRTEDSSSIGRHVVLAPGTGRGGGISSGLNRIRRRVTKLINLRHKA